MAATTSPKATGSTTSDQRRARGTSDQARFACARSQHNHAIEHVVPQRRRCPYQTSVSVIWLMRSDHDPRPALHGRRGPDRIAVHQPVARHGGGDLAEHFESDLTDAVQIEAVRQQLDDRIDRKETIHLTSRRVGTAARRLALVEGPAPPRQRAPDARRAHRPSARGWDRGMSYVVRGPRRFELWEQRPRTELQGDALRVAGHGQAAGAIPRTSSVR